MSGCHVQWNNLNFFLVLSFSLCYSLYVGFGLKYYKYLYKIMFQWRNKMEEKEKLKEAQLWYKRKLAMREDVEIEDIKEADTEQVEMLTEIPKTGEILTENK